MITKEVAYKTGDKLFDTIEQAQGHELSMLIADALDGKPDAVETAGFVAGYLLGVKAKVLDILTTTESSKPKARKINGGTKKRKGTGIKITELPTEITTEEKPPF